MIRDVVKDMLQTAKDQFHAGMMLDYDGNVGDDPHEFVRGIAKDAGRKALLVLKKARANPSGVNDWLVMNMAADATVGLMSGCAAAYEAAYVSAMVADMVDGRDAERDVAEAAQGMADRWLRVIAPAAAYAEVAGGADLAREMALSMAAMPAHKAACATPGEACSCHLDLLEDDRRRKRILEAIEATGMAEVACNMPEAARYVMAALGTGLLSHVEGGDNISTAEYATRVIGYDDSRSLAGLLSSIVATAMFMDGRCYRQVKVVGRIGMVDGVIDCLGDLLRPITTGDVDVSRVERFDKAFISSLLTIIRLMEDVAPETAGMWVTMAIRGEGLPGVVRKTLLASVSDAHVAGAGAGAGAGNNDPAVTAANGGVTVH